MIGTALEQIVFPVDRFQNETSFLVQCNSGAVGVRAIERIAEERAIERIAEEVVPRFESTFRNPWGESVL